MCINAHNKRSKLCFSPVTTWVQTNVNESELKMAAAGVVFKLFDGKQLKHVADLICSQRGAVLY